MNTVLIIDGNSLVHRAFHALPDFVTKNGTHTNAVYGFATMFNKTITDFSPTHVVVCFDTKAPTFRNKLYKEYRATRPKIDETLKSQFPLVKQFLDSAGIVRIEKNGLEADDLIGILATQLKNKSTRVIILTGDRDLMQLVDDTVYVLTPQIGYAMGRLYTIDEVKKKFGITPTQVPDFKSLAGDQSDNYKGVAGIGPKTAMSLLSAHSSLEEIYRNLKSIQSKKIQETLKKEKKNAFLSKKLATIITEDNLNFSLDEAVFNGYNEALHQFFDQMEFKNLGNIFFNKNRPIKTKNENSENKKVQLGLF